MAEPWISDQAQDPDAATIAALAAGDRTAPARLAARFEAPLRAYLRRSVGDPELVDELVQDVLVAVWKGAARFDGRARVSTWVFAIARRRAASALRRGRLATEPLDEELSSGEDISAVEHDDLRVALAALPPGQRAVLELTFVYGFSYSEIASILAIPVGTVKSRASAARGSLRAALEGEAGR